jgi:hypothetical protein
MTMVLGRLIIQVAVVLPSAGSPSGHRSAHGTGYKYLQYILVPLHTLFDGKYDDFIVDGNGISAANPMSMVHGYLAQMGMRHPYDFELGQLLWELAGAPDDLGPHLNPDAVVSTYDVYKVRHTHT